MDDKIKIYEMIFKAIATLLMTISLFLIKDFGTSLDQVQNSVNRLNISFATMSQKLIGQGYQNEGLGKKLEDVEKKLEERTRSRWTQAQQQEYTKLIDLRLEIIERELKSVRDLKK